MLKNNLFSSFDNSDTSFEGLQRTIIEKEQPNKFAINESLSESDQSTNEINGVRKPHPSIARLKGAGSVAIINESPNQPDDDSNTSKIDETDSFRTDTFSPLLIGSNSVDNSSKQRVLTSTQYPLNLAESYVADNSAARIQIDNSLSDDESADNDSSRSSVRSVSTRSSDGSIKNGNSNRILLSSDENDGDDNNNNNNNNNRQKPAVINQIIIDSDDNSINSGSQPEILPEFQNVVVSDNQLRIDDNRKSDASSRSDVSKKSVYSDEDVIVRPSANRVIVSDEDDDSHLDLKKKSKNKIDNSSLISLEANSANVSKAVADEMQSDLNQTKPPTNDENEFIVLSDSESPAKPPRTQTITSYFPTQSSMESPTVTSRKNGDGKPVASWSPNFEQIKAKIKGTMNQNQNRTMKMMEVTQSQFNMNSTVAPTAISIPTEINPEDFKKMQFQAKVVRGLNEQVTNRHYSYEHQLKELSEQLIKIVLEKPNPDEIAHDEEEHTDEINALKPSGLKVNLLNHQLYSMRWLKWRESTYPYGGILADDMGLGKTLTILSYLKLVKEKRDRALKKLKDEDDDDDEMDENDDEDDDEKIRRAKKYGASSSKSKPLKTLIVLPASLLHQWEGEINNRFKRDSFKYHVYHGDNRKRNSFNLDENDIVFTTYEIVSREVMLVDRLGNEISSSSPLAQIKWKRVILDEAHRIKNHSTKANKSVCMLRAKYRIAITGTPIHNSLTDFYSLVKFLHFAPLDDFSLWQYIFSSEKFNNKSMPKNNAVERQDRLNNWLGLLSSYLILRRTKQDKIKGTEKKIVDLPEKTVDTIKLKLDDLDKKIYEYIFKESNKKVNDFLQQRLLGRAGGGNFLSEILVYLLRLRQACCHMSLLSECIDKSALQNIKLETDGLDGLMQNLTLNQSSASSEASSIHDSLCENLKNDQDLNKCFENSWKSVKMAKLMEMITNILENSEDDKIIVVSQWTSMLRIVAKFLGEEEIEFVQISGDIPLLKRNEIVESFNRKHRLAERIMLLSLTAGGVGLNLIGANHMFLLDIHWNPALEHQAADRIFRVGQKKPVFVYRFICENTIEERILEIQEKKLDIAKKVCEASGATKNSAPSAKLTINDFKFLFKGFDTSNADTTKQSILQ